jgi:hypothetical protein
VIVGDELARGLIGVKDLDTGFQEVLVRLEDLVAALTLKE